MKIRVLYADRLKAFSSPIVTALLDDGVTVVGAEASAGVDVNFLQIHASPFSLREDLRFIDVCLRSPNPTVTLVHRPDELILAETLLEKVTALKPQTVILMGDHIPEAFRSAVTSPIEIIPHPYTDLSLPSTLQPVVIGTFTSFGEVRRLKDVLGVFDAIRNVAGAATPNIRFALGGIFDEKSLTKALLIEQGSREFSTSLLDSIDVRDEPFLPHFHTQLYHLHDRKRYCESSGSLHRGISIPVIFEANNIEHVEGIRVIKVAADDDLQRVEYREAAQKILQLIASDKISEWLNHNHQRALKNQPSHFARRLQLAF